MGNNKKTMSKSKIEYIKTYTDFGFPLKITRRKARPLKGGGVKSPRLLVKCGCCSEKVEIYYDNDELEINGVNGTIHQWRKVLLPLLDIKIPKGKK